MDFPNEPLWTLRTTADPATYLTLVEEQLTKDKLHVLDAVLQDEELVDTFGWDLVATLLPLLPDSSPCLLRIARAGNAKEVVLKVTESLRAVDFDSIDGTDESSQAGTSAASGPAPVGIHVNGAPTSTLPLPIAQFQILLQMLGILHPRIKAKFPSRFLSASLQAVLASYIGAAHQDVLTVEVIKFIKALTGTKRPAFPPRRTSSSIMLATLSSKPPAFGAAPVIQDIPESEEDRIQKRLLQSFLTHILDDYMRSLQPYDDISGLSWSSRYWEEIGHAYLVPNKVTITDRFSNSPELETRLTTVGQIVAVAQDLEIHSDDLLATILDPMPEDEGDRGQEEESPSSAASIPLSKDGALYLYTARKAMEVLYGGASINDDIPIFPGHALMARVFVENIGEEGLRATPEPLLDALLFHGLIALQKNSIGDPQSDEHFAAYLQSVSLVSAAVPSPSIRFHAHYLTTSVLRSHPKDVVRFAYIRDTLEHCPFENLKASAVGWIKDETATANKKADSDDVKAPLDANIINGTADDTPSLFASPIPLSTLCLDLWPDLTSEFALSADVSASASPSIESKQAYYVLLANYGFYSAALNFLLLLLRSPHAHQNLDLKNVLEQGEVIANFVNPLRNAAIAFAASGDLHADDGDAYGGDGGTEMELNLLAMLTDEINGEITKLGWTFDDKNT